MQGPRGHTGQDTPETDQPSHGTSGHRPAPGRLRGGRPRPSQQPLRGGRAPEAACVQPAPACAAWAPPPRACPQGRRPPGSRQVDAGRERCCPTRLGLEAGAASRPLSLPTVRSPQPCPRGSPSGAARWAPPPWPPAGAARAAVSPSGPRRLGNRARRLPATCSLRATCFRAGWGAGGSGGRRRPGAGGGRGLGGGPARGQVGAGARASPRRPRRELAASPGPARPQAAARGERRAGGWNSAWGVLEKESRKF